MKFIVMNLGCKVNAYEGESVAAELERRGHTRVAEEQAADLCVLFTCCVTNTAAQKSRQMAHRLRHHHPEAVIVLAGCYVQIDPQACADVDILVGTHNKSRIPDYVEQFLQNRRRIVDVTPAETMPFEEMRMEQFEGQTRAYLKVQDGCNQFCTYCIIPYARGRERSLAPDRAVAQAAALAQHHKEIVLSGIHTGRYGREYGVSLAELIRRILAAAPGLERIRISSIEMNEVSDELIELMHSTSRVARHLHIPLQAGCNTVLQRMHRPYSTADYYARIEEIRQALPGVSVSADLIVGFPQETDAEFAETVAFLKKCRFSFLHVFPYSRRDGTAAAALKPQIAPEVKKQRVQICRQLSEELYDAYKKEFLGRDVRVLIEAEKKGCSFGHSSEYLPVCAPAGLTPGSLQTIRLEELRSHDLWGKAVNGYESSGTL